LFQWVWRTSAKETLHDNQTPKCPTVATQMITTYQCKPHNLQQEETSKLCYQCHDKPKCPLTLPCGLPYKVRWYLNGPTCGLPYTVRQAVSLVSKAHRYGTNHSRMTTNALPSCEKNALSVCIIISFQFVQLCQSV
jgi:hypothetical protein